MSKKKMNALAMFAIFAAATAAAPIACSATVRNGTTVPNHSLCTGTDTPYCVDVGGKWTCSECSENCDCAPGRYCIKYGTGVGSCASISVGSPCARFPEGWIPTLHEDDALLCGSAAFSGSKFVGFEWIGSCASGKCAECDGSAAASSAKWSLACPGTACRSGTIISTRSSPGTQYLGNFADVAILVVVVLILAALLASIIRESPRCNRVRRPTYGRYESHGIFPELAPRSEDATPLDAVPLMSMKGNPKVDRPALVAIPDTIIPLASPSDEKRRMVSTASH